MGDSLSYLDNLVNMYIYNLFLFSSYPAYVIVNLSLFKLLATLL